MLFILLFLLSLLIGAVSWGPSKGRDLADSIILANMSIDLRKGLKRKRIKNKRENNERISVDRNRRSFFAKTIAIRLRKGKERERKKEKRPKKCYDGT